MLSRRLKTIRGRVQAGIIIDGYGNLQLEGMSPLNLLRSYNVFQRAELTVMDPNNLRPLPRILHFDMYDHSDPNRPHLVSKRKKLAPP